MDPGWEEVERLAQAASAADTQKASEQPCADTIARWRRLFGYSYMTAVHLIQRQREDGEYLTLHRKPCSLEKC